MLCSWGWIIHASSFSRINIYELWFVIWKKCEINFSLWLRRNLKKCNWFELRNGGWEQQQEMHLWEALNKNLNMKRKLDLWRCSSVPFETDPSSDDVLTIYKLIYTMMEQNLINSRKTACERKGSFAGKCHKSSASDPTKIQQVFLARKQRFRQTKTWNFLGKIRKR